MLIKYCIVALTCVFVATFRWNFKKKRRANFYLQVPYVTVHFMIGSHRSGCLFWNRKEFILRYVRWLHYKRFKQPVCQLVSHRCRRRRRRCCGFQMRAVVWQSQIPESLPAFSACWRIVWSSPFSGKSLTPAKAHSVTLKPTSDLQRPFVLSFLRRQK